MKKWILLYFLIISTCGFAQVKVGFQAGGNLSLAKSSGEYKIKDFQPYIGYDLAFTPDIKLNKNLHLQFSVAYSAIGYGGKTPEIVTDTTTFSEQFKYKLSYIGIPVNLVAKFDIGADSRFLLLGGLYANFLVRASEKRTYDFFYIRSQIQNKGTDDPKDVTDKYNKWNSGLCVGLGFEVNQFQIIASYNYSFSEVYQYSDTKINLSTIHLTLGFFF